MLSRRSVRIKVMQLLYAVACDEGLNQKDLKKLYWKAVDKSYDVFLYNFYNFIQVTKVAADDEAKRKSKHLPTPEDKVFEAWLCNNELIASARDNKKLQKLFEKKGFVAEGDRDFYKKIYGEFVKEEAYSNYILKANKTNEDHLAILLDLYRLCRKNELFIEQMQDLFINWIDDKSLVVGSVKKVIKGLPLSQEDDLSKYFPDSETVKEFGEELLETTSLGDSVIKDYIDPLLKNWDSDRVALVDMVLLKMAASEFLNFETIPAKVTINEYVEISKSYSTDKSREFVNGVLDKLMKNLQADDKLVKTGRGLID